MPDRRTTARSSSKAGGTTPRRSPFSGRPRASRREDADVQNRLGEALERIGALDAAVDAYRRALAERPAFRKASNNLILALVKTGKGPEAVERARALVAQSPGDADRSLHAGPRPIRTGRSRVQSRPSGSCWSSIPVTPSARYNLALVLRRADRLPEALAELERALAIEPRAEAHYTMGIIYWHQGELDRAAAALRAAVATEPRYADAYYALGSVLKARQDWTGAAAALRRAIDLRPDLPAAHYALGLVLQLDGDEVGARSQLDEAERLRRRAELEHEALVWTSVGIGKVGARRSRRRAGAVSAARPRS